MKRIGIIVLALVAFSQVANAQKRKIDGVVTSKNNDEVMESVVVWVKGTHQGMITGNDGHFDVIVNPGDTIEFSAKGYKTTELIVGVANIYKAELELEEKTDKNTSPNGPVIGLRAKKKY